MLGRLSLLTLVSVNLSRFNVFDGDNFLTFKIICPKCRRVNTLVACTC